ncbi:GPO family capsid scaffolding protein [Paraburkholderia guartelaensis]|uniref:GPO family capsid scaffolding protein n=1 Tax=Paraburkholderia guartelaensis TaxID=2546446 RepID=UPI002AB6F43F|nr:GPO family capsid scaffolding protein [Paraburkholderia guartelaensis]
MFKRKLSLVALAVGSMASLIALDAHAATTAIGAGLQHGDMLAGLGTAGAAIGLGIGSTSNADGNHASASKWFRVAVEGATTDGRNIEREWIQQMAAQYNTALYGARVNCEHIRGYAPLSDTNPFGAYGDVSALKAEALTDGPLKGKLALYAQITPTQALLDLQKARQKLYTSIEINFSFADTKQAYLIGLAVTDSPASLGTEMLAFAAGQGDNSPLKARKQAPNNLFSAAEETVIEFEPVTQTPAAAGAGLFHRVGEMLGFVKEKGATDDKRFTDITQAVELLATFSQEQAKTVQTYAAKLDELRTELDNEKAAHADTSKKLDELTAALSTQPAGQQRPPATGANGVQKTDC